MFSDAEVKIDITKLDFNIIKRYKSYPALLEALDEWILIPDRKLVTKLNQLSEIVKTFQPNSIPKEIYRGMNLYNHIQEKLDLGKNSFFRTTIKDHNVNDIFKYSSLDKAVSFTSDLNIAKAFGKTIVKINLNKYKGNYLVITDELSYLISELRNLSDYKTQKEVILLPPLDFEFIIVNKQ